MKDETLSLSGQDFDLVWELAATGPCSLETAPGDKDNWIERAGGSLPNYICHIAKGVMRTGKSKSAAIAIAVSRVKRWAAGGDDVTAKTRAKAAKAYAQWEALKAKHSAKKVVKASREDGTPYLMLTNVNDISLEQVRASWRTQNDEFRKSIAEVSGYSVADQAVPYSYVVEVYLNHIIVDVEGTEPTSRYVKVPYTTEGSVVIFGTPTPVELLWVDEENDWKAHARG